VSIEPKIMLDLSGFRGSGGRDLEGLLTFRELGSAPPRGEDRSETGTGGLDAVSARRIADRSSAK
jgi:hypothetical protein